MLGFTGAISLREALRDLAWLNANSPKPKKPKSSVDRVDWSVRDNEILDRVQSAVDKMLMENKPVRITVGKIGTTLGCKALLEKHLDKLPQTRKYLDAVKENVEDFQIRRIQWAIAELNNNGEDIKEWKILRLAGLRRGVRIK